MAVATEERRQEARTTGDVVWSFVFSYALALLFYVSLVWGAGFWDFVANTRILSVLIDSGIVKLHDGQQGLVEGMPSLLYYLKSQDPVEWGLVAISGVLFIVVWGMRASVFHGIARLAGLGGSPGAHARAYLYGRGIDRLMPFNIGEVATASTLQGQGASLGGAASVAFTSRLFFAFEILVFAVIGLGYIGWTTWLQQVVWGLVILGATYLLIHPVRRPSRMLSEGAWPAARRSFYALAQRPMSMGWMALTSIGAFGLELLAAYVISQAFTDENVILNIHSLLLLMGLVAGHLARWYKVTPGGLGQFEWGFAAALYLGGVGIPEAVVVAVLFTVLRYLAGGLVFGVLVAASGVETNLSRVFRLFRGPPEAAPEPQPAEVR